MIEAALLGLLLQTLMLALAAGAVRALQGVVARSFGAAAAYAFWLLVPVAMLAAALPHPVVDPLTIHVDVAAVAPGWVAQSAAARPAWHGLLVAVALLVWAAGALAMGAVLVRRQRRFEAGITTSGHEAPRLPAGSGPAVLGLWRRRIVLPQDFDTAFDDEERRLMLLHERVHLRRGDNAWNLLAAALLVLHWFNPVAWWAWRRMRADQETSCDATVLRHESSACLGAYTGALLKVQGVALTPPFATSWQSSHPLVERVRMLKSHRISSARHRTGLRIAALSIALAGFGGYALQAGASAPPAAAAADEDAVLTAVEIDVDGGTVIASKLLTRSGQTATVRYDTDPMKKPLSTPLEIVYTVKRIAGDLLQIDTTLRHGDPLATLASPRLITHDGEAARVEVKSADGAHQFVVSFVPKVQAAKAAAPGGAADDRKDQRAL